MKTAILQKPLIRKAKGLVRDKKASAKKISVRRMLVPVDFSEPSVLAIDYASKIATRLGAELNLIYVLEPPPLLTGMRGTPLYITDAESGLRAREHLRIVAELHELPLRSEYIHVRKGRPFDEICQLAREIDIDLIVLPTRGNTDLKHLALGSTAERVVRHAQCPVLVLRAGSKPGSNRRWPAESPSFRRIVVPVDFSRNSIRGLAYAKVIAREFASSLLLLNSVQPQYFVTNDEYARYDFPMLIEQVEKLAQRQMRELVRATNWQDLKVESTVEIGHAGQQICERARDRRADLIVISSHSRKGLEHMFIGSTAEFVVRHARCPVLVVPTRTKVPLG